MTLTPTPDTIADLLHTVLLSRHADFAPDELREGINESVTPEALNTALASLVADGRASILPNGRYLSDKAAARLRETARRLVTAFHKQNPLRRAMPPENLEAPLQKAALFQDFDSVTAWLVAEGVLVSEGSRGVRLPSHAIILPVPWQKPADEILTVYRAAGLQPPFPGNFQANYPRDVSVVGILQALTEEGKLVDLGDRIYISAEALDKTKAVLCRLADSPEGITVGGLRDAMESSRKVILPLLEYLDAQGVTRRVGEKRVLVSE